MTPATTDRMEIYIVRHAIAAERGPQWPDDSKRPLVERGVTRFKEAVDGLVWLDVVIEEIFTSPLVRARQTAELLSGGLPAHPPVQVLDALSPGHSPTEVLRQLGQDSRKRRAALVGHEPGLGELIGHLLGAKTPVPMKKGGVCRVDVDSLSARAGVLAWLLTPKILRKLGH
jgi:phosphohistidine phosphatase